MRLHRFAIAEFPACSQNWLTLLDWRDGRIEKRHETRVETYHTAAMFDAFDRMAPEGDGVSVIIEDQRENPQTPSPLDRLAADWTPDTFAQLLSLESGRIGDGMLWILSSIDKQCHFVFTDLPGRPLRLDVVTFKIELEREGMLIVEGLAFHETRILDRKALGWMGAFHRVHAEDIKKTQSAIWGIFNEAINPILKSALVDPFRDLMIAADAGRIKTPSQMEPADTLDRYEFFLSSTLKYLGGTKQEFEALVRAAADVFPRERMHAQDEVEVMDIQTCISADAHAAGAYALAPDVAAKRDRATRFIHEQVAPFIWPIGYDINVLEVGPAMLLSSYFLSASSHDVWCEEGTGHAAMEQADTLKAWLMARGTSAEEAEQILAGD
jgi:hypothetical protein